MAIFSFLRKKPFFTPEQTKEIVDAIKAAERNTSGEVRVYVESKNYLVDPIERAGEVFLNLKMQDTDDRNAVLLYIAVKDRELALFADKGIYEKAGAEYWDNAVKEMIAHFQKDKLSTGIAQCVIAIGNTLKEKFPYNSSTDKNELPDDIVFGK
ncbi:MAG: TPM domain-containing protein [Ferruginibacter sp.]